MNLIMRNRLENLLDSGSFSMLAGLDDNGELIGGTGNINGRKVCIIAINPQATAQIDPFEVLQQELELLDYAEKHLIPVIHLADRPKRVPMGTTAIPSTILQTFIDINGAGRTFARFAHLSGVVPRIAIVFRPIATTLTYPVAECDTVVMVKNSGMSLARPDMVKLMTGDRSPYKDYGSAEMHAEISGTCDMLASSEIEALQWVRQYLDFFPANYMEKPPIMPLKDLKNISISPDLIPNDPNLIFDMHPLLENIADEGSILEHRKLYARELITAFARIKGIPVAFIANNSNHRGGILFPETCRKLAAFASLCDSFNIPIVFLADLPGFMVGKDAEQAGIIHHGALVFSTIANLEVPHLSVVVRKAYTAGLYAMGGPGFDADKFLAFPESNITIYGTKALRMLGKKSDLSEKDQMAIEEQIKEKCSVEKYLEEGHLDDMISRNDLRKEITEFLERSMNKRLERQSPRRILCI